MKKNELIRVIISREGGKGMGLKGNTGHSILFYLK